MDSLGVHFSLPSSSLFSFPPTGDPPALAPPPGQPLFDIPGHIYEAALDPKVPITIATLYAITAKALNAFNESRSKMPWRVSKTVAFKVFVVAHNLFLAGYSAWTFFGMLSALRRCIENPAGPSGLVGFVDSFCKLQGTPGLGNGKYYDDALGAWSAAPTNMDAGRLWNDGLAYYGWLFYLSKFYEVLDTFIILAKGKISSTLQTYHHAGAMMCMWAGIRYMSPPIWMFTFVNSGIHAIMYTYYTITSFNVKVPIIIKRTLTTCQITQFLVGASYAMMHSFVSYTIPVSGRTEPGVPAEDVPVETTAAPWSAAEAATTKKAESFEMVIETVTHYESIPCITSKGETFAIWLNVMYLAPLTYLFVSFFISSYMRRSAQAGKGKEDRPMRSSVVVAEKAGWDAATDVGREVYDQGVEAPVAVSSEEEGDEDNAQNGMANGKVKQNTRSKKV